MDKKPEDVLQHFGILGMKWGRRSAHKSSSKKPRVKKVEDISEDAAKKNQLKKKKLSQMTNAELKTLNERLQLEKQYKDLTKADISPGKKFVIEVLKGAAKQTASAYVGKTMTKGAEIAMKKIIDI